MRKDEIWTILTFRNSKLKKDYALNLSDNELIDKASKYNIQLLFLFF